MKLQQCAYETLWVANLKADIFTNNDDMIMKKHGQVMLIICWRKKGEFLAISLTYTFESKSILKLTSQM